MIPCRMNPMGISPYSRRLQYLESTGTQYIDTGVMPDLANGDQIELKFYGAEMTGDPKSVFGSRNVTGGTVVNAIYQHGSVIVFGDSSGYTGVSFSYRNEHILTVNDTKISDNGNVVVQTPKRVTCDFPIYLFAMNNRGNVLGIYPGLQIYDWKFWHNGTLAQHLIPVLDRGGVPCMYDTISRSLKYNAGTGTFNYA